MIFRKQNTKSTLLIILAILLGSFITVLLLNQIEEKTNTKTGTTQISQTSEANKDENQTQAEVILSSPSPFPFQEMTIPYLRRHTFDSSIIERERISNPPSYDSYLASYTSDSETVYGQLTIPNGDVPEGGWPAVIFIHGYIPPSTYGTFSNYTAYVDFLAKRGMIVFKIDLRGHGNSTGEASGAYFSEDYIVDVLSAYSALEKVPEVADDKISLWGHSMAGNVVLRSVAVKKDIPKAVIFAGAVYTYQDFLEYGISDNSYRPPQDDSPRRQRREELFDLYPRENVNSWFWQQVAPTNYLSDVNTSLQLHHAINDTVVSVEYSRNLTSYLEDNSIEHELFEYASGGHNITSPAFTNAMTRTAEFLTTY